ncbi:MAG: retropepsin-like aspartic protease [Methylococcales bacterium]
MATIDSMISTIKRSLLIFNWLFMLIAVNSHAQDIQNPRDLFEQILMLQSQTKIEIVGMERIENEPKALIRGNTEQQIQQLFASFNHIISRNTKGQIERIVIVNKKEKQEGSRIVLPTKHQGNHLIVPVSISGTGKFWKTMDMLIDTGADLVVLPESMIDQLGMRDSTFTTEKIQTANGTIDAKIGTLQELKIAGETVENIPAAFIADAQLGSNSLLGMSVLGRFQVTIDDQAQTITLFKK